VKRYAEGDIAPRSSGFKKMALIVGVMALLTLAGLLSWQSWKQRKNVRPLPLGRTKIVRRIPPAPPGVSIVVEKQRAIVAAKHEQHVKARGEALPKPEESAALAAKEPLQEKTESAKPLPGPAAVMQETTKGKSEPLPAATVEKPRRKPAVASKFAIQVGAFRLAEGAERLVKQLREKGYDAYVDKSLLKQGGNIYRVRIRGYKNIEQARSAIARLEKDEGMKGFPVTLNP